MKVTKVTVNLSVMRFAVATIGLFFVAYAACVGCDYERGLAGAAICYAASRM
jgi:hypothetical protein